MPAGRRDALGLMQLVEEWLREPEVPDIFVFDTSAAVLALDSMDRVMRARSGRTREWRVFRMFQHSVSVDALTRAAARGTRVLLSAASAREMRVVAERKRMSWLAESLLGEPRDPALPRLFEARAPRAASLTVARAVNAVVGGRLAEIDNGGFPAGFIPVKRGEPLDDADLDSLALALEVARGNPGKRVGYYTTDIRQGLVANHARSLLGLENLVIPTLGKVKPPRADYPRLMSGLPDVFTDLQGTVEVWLDRQAQAPPWLRVRCGRRGCAPPWTGPPGSRAKYRGGRGTRR